MKNTIRTAILLLSSIILAPALSAQSLSPTGVQFGPYVEYNQGVGSIVEHEVGNAVFGLDVFYQLPLNLPEFIPFSNLGISATADFGTAVGKKDYIDSWNLFDLMAGVWFDWNFFSIFRLRPEVSYGCIMNFVESMERGVSGLHTDQLIRIGGTIIYEPVFMKGFAVYGGVDYKFMPEKENVGNFLGIKAGILYRPENTYRKKKAAEKAAKEQEILAEQARLKIEEEKRRQEELELARLEAETKAREAREKADAETLARLEMEKEALEAQLREAEEKAKAAEEAARIAEEKAAQEKAEAERIAQEEKARLEAEAKAKTVKKVEIVMNEDGSVNIAIPTLYFVSDRAELTSAKSNEETLQKVYEILNDPDYAEFKCEITGYVNPDNLVWTEAENQLALNRAQTVVENLSSKGIPTERLTTAYGSGKTTNKEYNRRVEFKLTK